MAKGHIKLGVSSATLRDYILVNPKSTTRQLANPMAVKLGSGGEKYDDQTNWSFWVADDWQGGAGVTDGRANAFLFSDAVDSRVPRQLILGPALGGGWTNAYSAFDSLTFAQSSDTDVEFVTGTAYAWAYGGDIMPGDCWVYLRPTANDQVVTLRIKNSGGTVLNSYNYTCSKAFAPVWAYFNITRTPTGVEATLEITSTQSFEIATNPTLSWAFFISSKSNQPITKSDTFTAAIFGHALYGYSDDTLYRYTAGVGFKYYEDVVTLANPITDMYPWGDHLYFAYGALAGMQRMDVYEVFSTIAGTYADMFTAWNGYLWRAYGSNVYYSVDGSTWSAAIDIGETVAAMCGMGNDMYVATKIGLYRIAPGDVVYGIANWGTVVDNIGALGKSASMVNYQGDLYVAVDNRIVRYTQSGQMSDVWLKDSGDLPTEYHGYIGALAVMNNWLVAGVNNPATNNASVWLWQQSGWHNACTVLTQNQVQSIKYDRINGYLWLNTVAGLTLFLAVPDYARNPYTATDYRYMPTGWIELGWFDGNLLEVAKDVHSLYMTGDNFSATQSVDVYWQDDGSAGSWELLGTIDANTEEITWAVGATRPNTKRIKLALALRTTSLISTPKIEAFRLKYANIVADRWRWNFNISVSDNQQMLDEMLNPYTAAEMKTHLDGLIKQVPPVRLTDTDGTSYWTKLLSASIQTADYRYDTPGDAVILKYVYSIVLEEIP